MWRKFELGYNMTRLAGTLHADLCKCMISRPFLPRMKDVPDKCYRENRNTHSIFSYSPPPPNLAVYEIMWKNVVELGRTQMTRSRIHVTYWLTDATNTHTEYVMLIAFPLQRWLGERASVLTFIRTYVVSCLFYSLKRNRVAARSRRKSCAAGKPKHSAISLIVIPRNLADSISACGRQWIKAYEFCTVIGMSDLLAFQNEVLLRMWVDVPTVLTPAGGPWRFLGDRYPHGSVWQCTGSHTRRNCGGKIVCPHLLLVHCGLACRILCPHCVGFRVESWWFSYRSSDGPKLCFILFLYCKIFSTWL